MTSIGLRTDQSMVVGGWYVGAGASGATASLDILNSSGSRSFCTCP